MKISKTVLLAMGFGMGLFFFQGNSLADNSSMTAGKKDKVESTMMNDGTGMKMNEKKMEGTMDSNMEKQMKSSMDKPKGNTMEKPAKMKMEDSMEKGKKMME